MKPLIDKYLKLSPDEEEKLLSIGRQIHLKKGDIISKAGSLNTKLYFVNKGVVRSYTIDENAEENTWFFSCNDEIFIDWMSAHWKEKSILYFEALAEVDCIEYDYRDVQEQLEIMPQLNKLVRIILEQHLTLLLSMRFSAQIEDLKTRYLKLMNERPELFQLIPQKYIASYLGAKPESLSRVKAQITKEYKASQKYKF